MKKILGDVLRIVIIFIFAVGALIVGIQVDNNAAGTVIKVLFAVISIVVLLFMLEKGLNEY